MRVFVPYFFILFFVASAGIIRANTPLDSVRLVNNKEKPYILHKVSKGETLSSLSRRYGCSVDEIKRNNKNIKDIMVGQKIKIPIPEKPVQTAKIKTDSATITLDESHANADSKDAGGLKKYTVQPGDNLNKIAAKNKVSVAQIAKWNGLQNNTIKIGQELFVSGSTNIKPYEKWNFANSLTAKSNQPENVLSSNYNTIEETGWAQQMAACSHPSLPIGSVVICINPDNLKQTLVTIIQQQNLSDGCVIGLSEKTLEILGLQNGQNRIIIKYNQPL
jgi:LysM repeat protein